MLGFTAVEKLFSDPQLEFAALLENRGLLINRNTQFESLHASSRAIPSLMSPQFYDMKFASFLSGDDTGIDINSLNTFAEIARRNNELLAAFSAKGYNTNTISTVPGKYFYPVTNNFYKDLTKWEAGASSPGVVAYEAMEDMHELRLYLTKNTLLSYRGIRWITDIAFLKLMESPYALKTVDTKNLSESDIAIVGDIYKMLTDTYSGSQRIQFHALKEILDGSSPRLVIIHNLTAHFPYNYDQYGNFVNRDGDDPYHPENYLAQHKWASKVCLAYIDLILAYDPDAVIVVQSDHGLHSDETERIFRTSGATDEDVRLMQNQTISAVRIPEKWGGLDNPLGSLNITRELVNRYVGPNYELLTDWIR
jgi:hypothetical protein